MAGNLGKPDTTHNNGARQGPASNFVDSNDCRRTFQGTSILSPEGLG
jgi:hypothetical protein